MENKELSYNDRYYLGNTIKVKHMDGAIATYTILEIDEKMNLMYVQDKAGYKLHIKDDKINSIDITILGE